jgi:hypothetical protein
LVPGLRQHTRLTACNCGVFRELVRKYPVGLEIGTRVAT